MSNHALPILILNMGGEMFYVLDQRLQAQKIPTDRSQKVLNEIAAVMLNERFLEEMFRPQPLYGKHELFLLFREIAHASIMKLNNTSMGKLYDLMVMVFKYQLYFAAQPRDILLITLNHLDSLRTLTSSPHVHKQLDSVFQRFSKTYYTLSSASLQRIRYELLNYFQDIHVKVSIFLRSGQQNNDGTFVTPATENVPYGVEVPGIIKVFNRDGSIKDIISFYSAGPNSASQIQGSLDLKGNRVTELGTSIYQDKSSVRDFMWAAETGEESQIFQSSEKSMYYSEINTLMEQLLGNKSSNSEDETILLDFFSDAKRTEKIVEEKVGVKTVTLPDTAENQNAILEKVASEVITLQWVLLVITLTRVNADDTHGIEKRDTSSESKKVVCYYTNWSVYRPGTAKFTPQNINPYLCTHLIYAFGGLDKENGLRPFDKYQDIEQGGYAKFTGLKTYNKNLKTMLAIGGWNEGSSRFSNLVADDERRAAFVKNVVKFLRQNNFDGLDLDWEYPAFRDGSKAADKENYASLVKELKEEFERESSKTGRSRLLLTMAVPAGIEYIDKGYDIPKLNRYLDFMNILSYDYHSAYEPNVNHHAPLYPLQEESEYNFDSHLTIDHTIKHYIKKGADPEKLILGIPTYGRSYTLFNPDSTDLGAPADGPGDQGEATREKGYLAYYEICGNTENDEWKIMYPKRSAMGPYAYRGNQWVGYDDIDIVKEKAKFVSKKELGGIMFWSIDNDDFRGKCHGKQYPLIEAGKETLFANNGTSSNTIAASTEEKRTKLGFRKNRPKHINTTPKPQTSTTRTTTTTTPLNPLSTPEPPTTPDPGTDFVCKEEGFFPHPRDCKKYFWCLDSGPSNLGIVAHQFTCPSGLLFNKAADSCDYSRNVICNKKSEKSSTTTSSTTAKSTTTASVTRPGTTATTTTTTTSTESAVEEEYEEEEEEDAESQEDPKAIKQLITLIKKLGGISELEKQLNIGDGSKEVTTPAISKNLYNKVFSGSANGRFKSQHRNAPPGPQNEGLSSNENVPYYRKNKPQYVTIQRSRPKNIPQDAEDSGTTNSKAVQLNADYADADEAEEEPVTTKSTFTTPRTRQTTAEARTTSLRYVVLDRHRQNRTTTTESEEEVQESPSSTTQRYITLIRHRQRTTSNEPEDETPTTESSPRATAKPASRSDKDEPISERSTEKVSVFENTTYAPTSPVTSAPQYTTTTTTTQNQTTTTENSLPNTTTNIPHTFLVYPQTMIYENVTQFADELTKATEQPELEVTTEPFTTSIATTVITTVRESATEITRIPLRMYREYIKKNRSDTFRHDLRSNVVTSELKKYKESPYSSTEKLNPTETTTRRGFLSRKRVSYSPTPVSVAKASSQSEPTTTHSRLFFRRNRWNSTTTLTDTSPSETTPHYQYGDTTKHVKSSEDDASKHRYNKFRSRFVTPASPESKVDIRNFFQQKRQSTSTEQYTEVPPTTINPFSKPNSRYFSRSRKTTTLESTASKEYPVTTTRARFLKDKFHRKTTSNDENKRYHHGTDASTERSVTDQITLSDSNEQQDILGRNNAARSIEEIKTTYATTDLPTVTENTDTEGRTDVTTIYTSSTPQSTTSRARSHSLETSSEQPVYLRIAPRNNSRFLKNPVQEFQTHKRKENFARGHSRYSPTTELPAAVAQRTYQKEFTESTKRVNDIADGQSKPKSQSGKGRSLNFESKNEVAGGSRGRHKYSDSPDEDSENTRSDADGSATARNFDFRRRSRIHYASPNDDEATPSESTTAKRPAITNRGSIKAKNSLSRAEIKELANLVETSSGKAHARKHHQTPINRIEENSNSAYAGLRNVLPTYRSSNDRLYTTVANQFVYDKIDPIFDFNDRIYEDRTESYYLGGVGNGLPTAVSEADSAFNDIFRVSETNYGNDDARRTQSTRGGANTDNKRNVVEPSTKEAELQPQVSIRQRGNFRRNNSSYSRSRSTTTPSTTTAEYSSYESNRLANRFKSRTRKGRPENRSINTARSENFIPLSETETATVIRHKNNDISQRGSTRISDYLPIPAPLYRLNQTIDQLGANNHINVDDVESQTISTPTEYSTDDISDLANPLVAAISNLKTAPPASSQTVFAKTVSPYSSPPIFTQTVAPYSPPISYTKEVPEQFHIVKSTPRTITAAPLYQLPKTIRRGGARHSSRTSTTTQLPSLQDIYNDYSDPELDYHAEPVDIPITGKVRIHSDGYIECLDMGNFPHPYSCKKFISCAKMEYNSLLGWEYTCPKGLSFDPIGGICNWSAGLGCKE